MKNLFRCPTCKSELEKTKVSFHCRSCKVYYPVVEGIPNLIPKCLNEKINSRAQSWNNLSYDYDLRIAGKSKERLSAIDDPLLNQCVTGKMVLEIGCGTARLKGPVEKRGCQYIGLDPSYELLKKSVSVEEYKLVQGVGEYLPFSDNYFDVILGGFCSFRYIQLDQAYAECARVLKPNGVLAFTLWNNWSLFMHSIAINLRNKRFQIPPFRTDNCNDVISPFNEIKRLARYGFEVESLLSTKKVPLPHNFPFIKKYFNWGGHWSGALGALIGYDVIFISKNC